jgi:hypothetical protein
MGSSCRACQREISSWSRNTSAAATRRATQTGASAVTRIAVSIAMRVSAIARVAVRRRTLIGRPRLPVCGMGHGSARQSRSAWLWRGATAVAAPRARARGAGGGEIVRCSGPRGPEQFPCGSEGWVLVFGSARGSFAPPGQGRSRLSQLPGLVPGGRLTRADASLVCCDRLDRAHRDDRDAPGEQAAARTASGFSRSRRVPNRSHSIASTRPWGGWTANRARRQSQ